MKYLRAVHKSVAQIYRRGIYEGCPFAHLSAVCFVDMSEKMELRTDLLNFSEQTLAASILIVDCLVQDAERRPMSYQDVDILWNTFPEMVSIFFLVHKAPVAKLNRIGRAEDLNSLDFD